MSKGKLIYIADDEVNICNIIKSFLVNEGFETETFFDGTSVFEAFNKRPADLLVIDVMMPGTDGFSLCSSLRSQSSVPIIIVSAKDTVADRIAGLSFGCDDYLTKPFSPMELIARVKSIFRRIELDKVKPPITKDILISDISVKPYIRQAEIMGKNIGLTGMEFDLLYYLVQNKNKAISRSELLDRNLGL